MLGASIIVLRETLEAALLIGILAAATRSIAGRGLWIGGGILAGLIGAGVVAALTGHIAALFEGLGQEYFNAAILAVAVVLLGSHQVWMSAHAGELVTDARQIGMEVREGRRQLSAILILIGLTVLREGSESSLFLYGLLSESQSGSSSILLGGAMGLLAGVALGGLLYAGMLRIPMRWFFSVTGLLIVLLAAGMASRMTRFLIQADLLPSLRSPLWDTSSALPIDSIPGALLNTLAGYDPAPAGMQVVFYVATLLIILAGSMWVQHPSARPV